MKTMQMWLDEYGDSHRNPTNKTIHWICVPAILFTVLGLLWLIPVPDAVGSISPLLNWSTLLMALAVVYYLVLSPTLAVGMALIAIAMFAGVHWVVMSSPIAPWILFVGIFVAAWIGQFIGHKIEGKKPSFFKDLQFLLIGPAWLMAHAFRKAGIKI